MDPVSIFYLACCFLFLLVFDMGLDVLNDVLERVF